MGQNQAKYSHIPKPSRSEREHLESMGFIVGSGTGMKFVNLTLPEGYEWKDRSWVTADGEVMHVWYIVNSDNQIVAKYNYCFSGEAGMPYQWIDGDYDREYFDERDNADVTEKSSNPNESQGPLFPSRFGETLRVKFVDNIWDICGWN